MDKALYSVRETAAQLSVSPDVVRAKIRSGNIRAVGIGKRVLVSAEEIRRIAREGCVASAKAAA
jgi:excisionase family DNA binding protein